MSNFYNTSNQGGANAGGNGFHNSGGAGGGAYGGAQYQQPQTQQPAYANVSQWQQSSSPQNNNNGGNQQQSQTQMSGQSQVQQQQQQQSSQQAPMPNFWNPATAATVAGIAAQAASGGMTGDTIMDMGTKVVMDQWGSASVNLVPGLNTTMQTLRAYFAVDNRYVKRKMGKVLFPFTSKQWKRIQTEGPEIINYALPNSDENAPDLYLPFMSLITYCLLCALLYGTAGEFNPEVIADVTTKCFMTQILEVLIIRFGFYMMQAPIAFLDLFSYTGYKYLGLTCNILTGMGFGQMGYGTSGFYVTYLWTASAISFFMLKTMANNIPNETSSEGPKREVMVLAFAASQAASMWFVSQTKFL